MGFAKECYFGVDMGTGDSFTFVTHAPTARCCSAGPHPAAECRAYADHGIPPGNWTVSPPVALPEVETPPVIEHVVHRTGWLRVTMRHAADGS